MRSMVGVSGRSFDKVRRHSYRIPMNITPDSLSLVSTAATRLEYCRAIRRDNQFTDKQTPYLKFIAVTVDR